jgi:exodeoxyribonuclease-5
MIEDYMAECITACFPFTPTDEQSKAIRALSSFLMTPDRDALFILRGYAGTGKTLLVSALVKMLAEVKRSTVLLAPTGRAAKVFSAYSDHPAFTIHKHIYRQKSFSAEMTDFSLNVNLTKDTLFIVDEASMISNEGLSGQMFGTGLLLDDLVHFVYNGQGCRLVLIGDTAQLPPVGEEESPALSDEVMKGYGLHVQSVDLVQVVRQAQQSGILWNASNLRQHIEREKFEVLPKIRLTNFADIRRLPGDELIETLSSCYDHDGMDQTVVITRSNKRANIYNNGIRAQILFRDDELESGDVLMIAKNNYFWTAKSKEMDFIANGENVVVRRVRHNREVYGFRFADVCLSFPDYDDFELDATLLLDTLHTESPALPKAENDKLFNNILVDYADIPLKRDRMKKMKEDTYYNALQVKYAYAITCHKAQGGQWKNVFLDQAYVSPDYLTPDYFRWLYTALTRATGTLYLVNYPEEQVEK